MGPILVFGHKKPDNDSICSAVAYAHLKNLTDNENVYLAGRLGPVPPETSWVFARFGVDLPEQVEHVYARVKDCMTCEVVTIDPEATMLEAGRLMRELGVRALPVVEDGSVKGIINTEILAELYLDDTEIRGFTHVPVTVERLMRVLDGTLLVGDEYTRLAGNVRIGAMEPATMLGYLGPGDTLILGDRQRTQPMAIDVGVACLIITGGTRPDEDVLDLAREKGTAVISTFHDTYAAARKVNLSHRVADHMDTSVLVFEPETLLSEAVEDLLESPLREAVVVDSRGQLAGIITRTNVARDIRRRVVLVDHNEIGQSALGIETAAVTEIVDHHRVGDVQTTSPVLFLNLPVGSTATIVTQRYDRLGMPVPAAMAGLLLSAVLSDTLLLKSPTTTDDDRQVAAHLGTLLGLDPLQFGLEMFRARSAGRVFSAEEAVNADTKEYRAGDLVIAVGQLETVDSSEIADHAEEVRAALETFRESKGYDLVVLMITDVVQGGSEILAAGRTRLAERALGVSLETGSAWMDGVLSRKKQVAAPLIEAAS